MPNPVYPSPPGAVDPPPHQRFFWAGGTGSGRTHSWVSILGQNFFDISRQKQNKTPPPGVLRAGITEGDPTPGWLAGWEGRKAPEGLKRSPAKKPLIDFWMRGF